MHDFYRGKKWPKTLAHSVKVNNRPKGENSPNLVSLKKDPVQLFLSRSGFSKHQL
jgi:hypothetical protein